MTICSDTRRVYCNFCHCSTPTVFIWTHPPIIGQTKGVRPNMGGRIDCSSGRFEVWTIESHKGAPAGTPDFEFLTSSPGRMSYPGVIHGAFVIDRRIVNGPVVNILHVFGSMVFLHGVVYKCALNWGVAVMLAPFVGIRMLVCNVLAITHCSTSRAVGCQCF